MSRIWPPIAYGNCGSSTAEWMDTRARRPSVLFETLKLALTAIRRNVLRSVLTLLGVTIGVAAVVALVTLGQGTTASVSNSISSLGSNMLVVQPGQMGQNASAGGMSPLGEDDGLAILRQVGGLTAVAP